MKEKQEKIVQEVDKNGYTPDSCMYMSYARDVLVCKDPHLTEQAPAKGMDIYEMINRHLKEDGIDITRLTPEQYQALYPQRYGDVSEEINDFAERYGYLKELEVANMEKWNDLPKDIRDYFGNNPSNMFQGLEDPEQLQKFQEYLKRQNEAKSEVKVNEKVD